MSGTYDISMGDRGRLVVPAEVRERSNLAEGTKLILVDTGDGIVLLTQGQLRERVRNELADVDLLEDLLCDRRHAAAEEDAASEVG